MEQMSERKVWSKLRLREPRKTAISASFAHSCINLTWTVLLVWLTWYPLTGSDGSSLTDIYKSSHQPQDTSTIPIKPKFSIPILNDGGLDTVTKTVNGRLRDDSNIFRQPPSLEVDAAWNELLHDGEEVVNVTANDLRQAGYDPDGLVRWNEVDDAYPVYLEWTHHIHCLNLIRKEMWHDYYFTSDEERKDAMMVSMRQEHAMHCMHMLLQDIRCNVELNIIPVAWMPSLSGTPGHWNKDFRPVILANTTKTCRDVDAADRWLKETADPNQEDNLALLRPPANARLLTGDGY